MTVSITKFLAVDARAVELGYNLPVELVFLPANFTTAKSGDDLMFRGEASTVTKLLKSAGISISRLGEKSAPRVFVHNKSHEWALPIIFIGAELMKSSPDVISAAFDLIKDYVKDSFNNVIGEKSITAEVVIEDRRSKSFKKITYEGPPEGLKELNSVIKTLRRR